MSKLLRTAFVTLLLSAVAAPASLAAAKAPATCSTAPTALVPCAHAMPSLTGRAVSARSILATAPAPVARALKAHTGTAERYTDKDRNTLDIAAWRLANAATAQRVVRQWTKAAHTAVIRSGAALAFIRFRTSATGTAVETYVKNVAATEAAQLKTALTVTPFDALAYAVSQSGHLTPKLALQAFAMIGGTGPGVPKVSPSKGLSDGTQALEWVLQERSHFTAAQQKAVRTYLAQTFPQVASAPKARAADAKQAMYQQLADDALELIEQHTGPLGITPDISTSNKDNGIALATTYPLSGACAITVYPLLDDDETDVKEATLAHELGHCMQHKYRPITQILNHAPMWLEDGLPSWIADEVVPPRPGANWAGWLTIYDLDNGRPLSGITYDGSGFFGHIADVVGADTLWSRVPAIMRAMTTPDGLAAAVGPSAQAVYDTWGSAFAARTDLGPNWHRVDPPGAAAAAPIPFGLPVTDTTTVNETPDEGDLYNVDTMQPFLVVTANDSAYGWLASTDGKVNAQIGTLGQRRFCTVGDCSQCPAGMEGTPPFSESVPVPLLVGLSGGSSGGGTVTFTAEPWSKYCHTKEIVPRLPQGSADDGDAGSSQGDPHLETGDGDFYDFQALGEFTLVKSTTDNLEIQGRQQRWTGSPNDVALDTAYAMSVGKSRVEVDATVSGTTVLVNGRKRTVDAVHAVSLPGGGRISINSQGDAAVRWPDGSVATLGTITDGRYLEADVQFHPTKTRRGKLVGLLGNFNGNAKDDFVSRTGTKYDASVITDDVKGFKLLYGSYANSWRIKQADSLFTYARGKNTHSYTIKPFPRKPFSWTAVDQAAAKNSCIAAGVTEAFLLANCSADYHATKQDVFVAAAAARQLAKKSTPATPILASDPVPVGKTGYKLTVLAIAATDGGKPDITVDLTRADGDNLQSHTYTLSGSALSSAGTSASVTAPSQALGQLNLRFVATGGTTFSKPPAGCTGPFTIKQRGVMTGTLVLHADAGSFGTITLKSLPGTLSHEQLGAQTCTGPAAAPGDVTLSAESGTNPIVLLTATHRATGTELTASSVTTNADGSTVAHTITSPGLPASALTAAPDLSSAQLTGSGPFLTGSLAYTGSDPLAGSDGSPFNFGTAQGNLTLQFDSIGPLQPWATTPADAQLAPAQ